MAFHIFSPKSFRRGDTVSYCISNETTYHQAKVTGFSQKDGQRIVFLDDNRWCYCFEVKEVIHTSQVRRKS